MSRWLGWSGLAALSLAMLSAQAQTNYQTPAALIPEAHETPREAAPLFFREGWKVTPGIPLLHPAGQGDVGNPNLELALYGPSGKEILMNGAPDLPLNPPHFWTGMCEQTCAAALHDRNNYVDLSGWGKIRWVTREGGLNQLHVILKLADGTWLVSEHGDAVGLDHHVSEFTLSESRWIGLDINRVVTRGLLTDKVDLSKVDEIGFTTLMPGSGHGYGGYADMVWMEVYGKPVPRLGVAMASANTSQPSEGAGPATQALAPYADKAVTELLGDSKARAIGQQLFADNCAACHGADARGKTGFPDLSGKAWQWGGTPSDILAAITAGRAGLMPGWKDAIGARGVEDVLAYTLSLSGRPASGGDAVHGKELFRTTCASCHGFDGKGNPPIGAPNLTDQYWLFGSSVEAIRQSIAAGRHGVMPAYGAALGTTRVKLLAAYVLGLGGSGH